MTDLTGSDAWRDWELDTIRFSLPRYFRALKARGMFTGKVNPQIKDSSVTVSVVDDPIEESVISVVANELKHPPRLVDEDGSMNRFHVRGSSVEFPGSLDVRLEVVPPTESGRKTAMRWEMYLKLPHAYRHVDLQCFSRTLNWSEFEAFGRRFISSIKGTQNENVPVSGEMKRGRK